MTPTEVIKAKRNKQALSPEQIQYFIEGYTQGAIPDYQMSSLLMAIVLNGMNVEETVQLTQVMLDSGVKMQFDESTFPVDKHSTGGVGDKTSLILAPIVAACGLPVPMMSGRGLGHTGGTLDKLESIPGFNVMLSLNDFKKMVTDVGLSFIGQTQDICPADKKIYSLRDVTGTVESLPLICASIMSKKIAEGIKGLVLDVKVGRGAFMKTLDEAKALAESLMAIGRQHGLKVKALLTDMNQPLGQFVGNAVEVKECLDILKREGNYKSHSDTEHLSVELAAHMISIGHNIEIKQARHKALEALNQGSAYEKFEKVCKIQNGNIQKLPQPTQQLTLYAPKGGYLSQFECEQIGVAAIEMGAGRKVMSDKINPVAGIQVHIKQGQQVSQGDPLFTLWGDESQKGFSQAQKILEHCCLISEDLPKIPPLIHDLIKKI